LLFSGLQDARLICRLGAHHALFPARPPRHTFSREASSQNLLT
jgi:hypothetical protein